MIVNKWRHLLCVAALHLQTLAAFTFSFLQSVLFFQVHSQQIAQGFFIFFQSTTMLTLRIWIYVDGFIFNGLLLWMLFRILLCMLLLLGRLFKTNFKCVKMNYNFHIWRLKEVRRWVKNYSDLEKVLSLPFFC